MWRAVVAMAHADGIVTPHEINFLLEQIKNLTLSPGQLQTLAGDLSMPQDIHTMFTHITDANDKRDFFKFARILSWSDGDFDAQEQHILDVLEQDLKDDDNRRILEESRNAVKEIVLQGDQWEKQVKGKGFMGFLGRLAG
jgi:uncharacterized membrane protein YebE (DUF533 family)